MSCLWRRQGIYRRADANVGLGRMRKALTDYKRAAQVNPRDPDLRKKLAHCEKEVKRIRFEEAVATPVRFSILHLLSVMSLAVSPLAPALPHGTETVLAVWGAASLPLQRQTRCHTYSMKDVEHTCS